MQSTMNGTDKSMPESLQSRSLVQQSIVAELGMYALKCRRLSRLVDKAVELVVKGLDVEYSKVLELLPDGRHLLLLAGYGWRDGYVGNAMVEADRASQAGYMLLCRKPVIVRDFDKEKRFRKPQLLEDHGVAAGISVVIHAGKDIFGVLGAHTSRPRRFNKEDIQFLQSVANVLGSAIELDRSRVKLKESEERFRRFFEASFEGVAIHDRGVILDANKRLAEMLGYEPSEIIGRHALEFAAPESRELIMKHILSGYTRPYEAVGLKKNGERFYVEIVGKTIPYKGKKVRASALRDITERKRAEKALVDSEQKFKFLSEESPNMIFINRDGRVVYANKRCEEIMGYTREEFYSEDFNFLTLIAPESRALVLENLERHNRGEDVEPYEYKLITKDGREIMALHTTRLIEYEGGPAILGIVTDITKQKEVEAALRESEERYRRFFDEDLTGDFIFTPDGRLTSCNPAFLRIFGYDSVDAAMEDDIASLFPSEEGYKEFLRLVEDKGRLEYYETELRRCDGRRLYVIGNVIGSFDDDGRLKEIRAYLFDNTPRKKIEEQFLQSQKMEALGRLAGGIAHDFNNLLTAIIGNADLLLYTLNPEHSAYEKIKTIRDTGERAAQLTRQLLAFSRKEVQSPVSVDINETIRSMTKMLSRLVGEDIRLHLFLTPEVKSVRAGSGQIEQIILNLVVNARDAMPSGGELTISTENVYLCEDYCSMHIGLIPGDHVMLKISDTGIGMPAEVLEYIFDPFFTTKKEGSGLGLSTVYGIVKQLGGEITVKSEVDRGTTFRLYLPALKEDIDEYQASSFAERDMPGGKETLLVVEDEPNILELAEQILVDLGYTVFTAGTGEEALGIARDCKGAIDLLITDVVLPGIKGTEVADEIKKLFKGIKVLFMSGYAADRIANSDILEGRVSFLPKPFTPSELAKKIRETLDG